MFTTKSVENIQFLPFLTTDVKYSGVAPWGGHGCGGQQNPPGHASERLCRLPRSNLSWLGYGVLKQDWTLIAVNTAGATLQTLYILVYLYYSPAKVGGSQVARCGDSGGVTATLTVPSPPQRPVLLQSLLLLAVLAAGYGYFTLLIEDARTRLARLGLFCSVFTISMYLSPLADLVRGAGEELGGSRWRCRGCQAREQPDVCFRRPRLFGAGRRAACPSR